MKPTNKETQIIEYDITAAAIEEMKKKYGGMKITDPTSDKAVRHARTLVVSKRTAVEKKRKELKASAIEWGRRVDDEAKRICALLLPLEEELKAEGKRIDEATEAKREEKARKERERIEAIQEKINYIRAQGIVNNLSASHIEERLIIIQAMATTELVYMEFNYQALEAKNETIKALKELLMQRLQFEKEAEERAVEAERLEAQRKEQEAAQAKREQLDKAFEDQKEWFKKHIKGDSFQIPTVDELEKAIPALEAITNHEVHEPAIKLLLDEQVTEAHGILAFGKDQAKLAEAQAKIDEENRKIKGEKAKIEAEKKAEAERKEKEAFQKKAQEEAEAAAAQKVKDVASAEEERAKTAAAEKARQEALRPDRDKLIKFAEGLIDIEVPHVTAGKAITIIIEAQGKLSNLAVHIKKKAKEL